MLAIFVQDQRSKSNLFLHTKSELSHQQALLLSIQFGKQISSVTDIKGQLVLLDTYRAIYSLLNEVYVVTIGYLSDYPFAVVESCENIKKYAIFEIFIFSALCTQLKGTEITSLNLSKRCLPIYTVLEEILYVDEKKEKEEFKIEKEKRLILEKYQFDNNLDLVPEPDLLEHGFESFDAPTIDQGRKTSYFEEESRFKEFQEFDQISKESLESMMTLSNTLITPKHFEPKLRTIETKLDSFQPLVLEEKIDVKLPPPPKVVQPKPEPPKDMKLATPPRPQPKIETKEQVKVVPPVVQPNVLRLEDLAPIQPVIENKESINLLPITIAISETIHISWKNQEMLQYKVIGKLSVKRFSNDHITQKVLKFRIRLRNTKVVHHCVSNKNLCTDLNDFGYDCEVPVEEFGPKQDLEVALLKYTLSPEFKPIPLQIMCKRIMKDDGINFMIKYKMNPNTLMDKLSFLVHPIENVDLGVKISKCEFKPDAKWNGEKLLWRFISPEKENKLMVIFKTDQIPNETKMGLLLLQFTCIGSLFSRISVDGCDGKKNEQNQVFVGGVQSVITSGKYEIEVVE